MVGDGGLVDAEAMPGDLGREFRLETEAIGAQRPDPLQHLAPEDLVAGLHVGQVQVRQHVREKGQRAVPEVVPEQEHALRAAEEAGSIDNIGLTFQYRPQQVVVIPRVVFEIRVLDEQDPPPRFREATAKRRSLAAVLRLEQDPHPCRLPGWAAHHFLAAVDGLEVAA